MRIANNGSLVSLGLSAVLVSLVVALVSSCGSTTLSPADASGTAGTSASGTAGTTATAGTDGAAGTHGTAGSHGSIDGGAGKTGGAGSGGGCACTEEYAPVCGSDGHTYSNACAAACAGVTVAHTGVCTDAGTDAKSDAKTDAQSDGSTDGPGVYCDQDSDCIYRQNTCSCTGLCVAKTDPAPAIPKYTCDFVCPAIAYSCGCVNHQCSPAAATGAL